jgi:hypothetical protein
MRRASGESAEPIAHKRLIETGGAFSKFGYQVLVLVAVEKLLSHQIRGDEEI